MSSFANMKKNAASAITKLVDAAEKLGSPKTYGNEGFWAPTVDKAGNGYAIIRFLPAKEGEALPWIQYWDHGFKGPTGRWYIENSLTSIGLPDPVSEANSILWNTGRDEDKQIVRDRKRRLHYVSNIEVISDPGNAANEGKVFRYKYGKKIFDKLMDAMQPQFPDEAPMNPFDMWAGANFKLRICQVEGFRNYDKSAFDKVSAHRAGDDAQLEEVYGSLQSLDELVDPKNYKSYAELKTKFNAVIGQAEAETSYTTSERVSLDEVRPAASAPVADEADLHSDEGDTTLSYFAKLAAQ